MNEQAQGHNALREGLARSEQDVRHRLTGCLRDFQFGFREDSLGSARPRGFCDVLRPLWSFLVTTPGVLEPGAGRFPALSAIPGQFLIKDMAPLGISLWSLDEAWGASEGSRPAA
ncbi:MAG TPA: DUF417 family protein [Planctomycetaceae bacterium]|jgi:hypothetical protein|nr:DUF417 family protein [Planctomycetaceae bacterium]